MGVWRERDVDGDRLIQVGGDVVGDAARNRALPEFPGDRLHRDQVGHGGAQRGRDVDLCQEFLQPHGRGAVRVGVEPVQGGGGTHRVEQPLEAHLLTLQPGQGALAPSEVEVMPPEPGAGGDGVHQGEEFIPERLVAAVDQRGPQPFADGRIAADGQPDGLDEVPAVHVEDGVQGRLDHVARAPRRQVVLRAADVEEPAVVVAVGRGEPPRARPGLDRPRNPDAVLGRDPAEPVVDRRHDGRVHGRVDTAQPHHPRSLGAS